MDGINDCPEKSLPISAISFTFIYLFNKQKQYENTGYRRNRIHWLSHSG